MTFPVLSRVPADSTGTHSLYTTYKDYELMFHVSTMLPYTPNNRQQVSQPSSSTHHQVHLNMCGTSVVCNKELPSCLLIFLLRG